MRSIFRILAFSLVFVLLASISYGQSAIKFDQSTNFVVQMDQVPKAASYTLDISNLNIGNQADTESFFKKASTPVVTYSVNYADKTVSMKINYSVNDAQNWNQKGWNDYFGYEAIRFRHFADQIK